MVVGGGKTDNRCMPKADCSSDTTNTQECEAGFVLVNLQCISIGIKIL